MPWSSNKDAKRHTRAADTSKRQRQWRHVANGALDRGESEASAVRMANAVVKRSHRGSSRRSSRRTTRRG